MMLTREQINSKMAGFECPKYLYESCWKPIHDQCMLAIDLTAENENLNVKLDAVKTVCKMRQYGLMESEFDYGLAQMADEIMAIIGKDGDEQE